MVCLSGRMTSCLLAIGLAGAFWAAPAPVLAEDGFRKWVQSFRTKASSAGVSRNTFDRAFQGIEPDSEVLVKASRQPEFIKPIWEYLDSAVSDKRIENGRAMGAEWDTWLRRIEAKYGVDRYVVLAIWGMESSYGAVLDNPKIVRGVVRSLATLAYQGGRRSRFGNEQLLAALQILERGDVSPDRMTGSWAGAMGHTQFIPTTYNAYAVDVDGDGRRNIWTSIPDALASTAHYLAKSGWQKGETWGYEVELSSGFDFSLADGKTVKTLSEWQKRGIRRTRGRSFPRPGDSARLLLPAGANGPAFLMLKNFRVIKRYNNADAYALGVGHLSDRLRGGDTFQSAWPRDEIPVRTKDGIRDMQKLLTRKGFNTGGVDGRIGPKTRQAIRSYQKSAGLVPDGYASEKLLQRIRGR